MTNQGARGVHPKMTEKQLQESVRKLAKVCGWLYYHTHNSRYSPAGFPDCVFVRDGRVFVAELKSDKGKLTNEQREWIEAFLDSEHIKVFLWRPNDWHTGRIETALKDHSTNLAYHHEWILSDSGYEKCVLCGQIRRGRT